MKLSRARRVRAESNRARNIESSGIQRQRLENIDREQPFVAEVCQHVDEQACGLSNQGPVPWVMLGNVVPSRRSAVRTLDQEAKERLLLRREEHDERRALPPDQPACVDLGVSHEGDLHPEIRLTKAIEMPLPDEPLLNAATLISPSGQRDMAARVGACCRLALKNRIRRLMTAAAHPFDAAQEQQGLDVEFA